jgi:hypothetical protein
MTAPPAPSRFRNYPAQPASPLLKNAFLILCNAHDAASAFLDVFEREYGRRGGSGAPTDEEQDLLRAMLTFASAGLDSMLKQLIRDSLGEVIEGNEGARVKFKSFLEKRVVRREPLDAKFVVEVLASSKPMAVLVDELVRDLCADSLQSKEQLLRAAAYFDIPSSVVTTNLAQLDSIFGTRNQIAHEMDVDFSKPNRSRRPRRKRVMIDYSAELLTIGETILRTVDGAVAGNAPARSRPRRA